MTDWKNFAVALLGSWPSQVAAWGEDAIAAYVAEIQARGVTAEDALRALRASDARFPPSAGELVVAAQAIATPRLTAGEAQACLFGAVSKYGRNRMVEALAELESRGGPVLAAFAATEGWERLCTTEFLAPDYGELRCRELRLRFDEFADRAAERQRAGLPMAPAARGIDGPHKIDATRWLTTPSGGDA